MDFFYVQLPQSDSHMPKLGGHFVATKGWRFPNNLHALMEVNRFYPSPERAEMIRQKQIAMKAFLALKSLDDVPGNPKLRPYQRVDAEYIGRLPHALLASEMRTGKTPTALHTVRHSFNLIVCPASILLNWRKEIRTWLPKSSVHVMKGSSKQREKLYASIVQPSLLSEVQFLIVSYETLRNDIAHFTKLFTPKKRTPYIELGMMIADEAHRLNNHQIPTYDACFKIGKLAQKRLAITATPSKDDGTEIYGILHWLYPEKFPGYWPFVERYWNVSIGTFEQRDVGKMKRQKELQEMIALMSVNRRRKEVMAWLPEKQRIPVELEMGDKQRRAYRDVLDTFVYEEDGEVKVDASGILAQLTRLRQICLAPELLDIDSPSVKEQYIKEWLADNPTEQVIIFSGFTSYLKILSKKLEKYRIGMIVGDMTATARHKVVEDFQAGRIQVILANIEAGGVGLTLDKAENVIFLDKHYNPTLNQQAEDRIIPVSEERNHSVTITSLVCIDSVDEKVEAILNRKQNIIQVINEIGVKIFQN